MAAGHCRNGAAATIAADFERFAADDLRPRHLDLHRVEFQGGGGTDFTPLLEEADRHHPDITVVLTDLEGPARMQPRWP